VAGNILINGGAVAAWWQSDRRQYRSHPTVRPGWR
jgi:hypothetical protein